MKYYAGIDLHSNNNYIGIIDESNKRVFKKKVRNDLKTVLWQLEPYRSGMEGVVVESTFNWYWMVDGLMDNGYRVHLANPSAIKQYEGLKYGDDVTDTFHLANLLRLGILPEGYIYPKEERPIRDLMRKRLKLVQQRTANILSFQNLVSRNLGRRMSVGTINKLGTEDLEHLFGEKHLVLSAQANIRAIQFFTGIIKQLEKSIKKAVKLRAEYKKLKGVPGIWDILALTIMLETGDIKRFAKVGNYSSYCRCVNSRWFSNGKAKGKGNSKNGNKYLSWAYVEAANHALWNYDYVERYYKKKMAKTNHVVAIKTIAHKLARACYYIIRDQEDFDPKKVFV